MRYDILVYLQSIVPGKYDPETGNHDEDTVTEVQQYASVTSTNTETLNLVYGEIRQGSFVVRLQNRYTKSFDRIRIGNKQYSVDYRRPLRNKETFVVSEVQ